MKYVELLKDLIEVLQWYESSTKEESKSTAILKRVLPHTSAEKKELDELAKRINRNE